MSNNLYDELINRRRRMMTQGEVTNVFAAIVARQEVRNQMVGLNANVWDLETKFLETEAGVDARLDQLTTAANNCGHLFRENQREVYNAQKRVYNRVVVLLCVLTCLVTCIGMNFGWVFYMEAIAEQARADAATARVAYLKELWLVKAYFQRDWVMTVAWAEYYHFKAWFS